MINHQYGPDVIKFKVLNRTDKHMPPVMYVTLEELLSCLVGCGTVDPWPRKESLQDLLMFRDNNTNMGNIRLFTGFQDSEGKDIYGGDLVSHYRDKGKPDLVHWNQDGWYVGFWVPGHLGDWNEDLTVVGESE